MRPQDAGRGERGVGAKPRAAAADLGVAAAGPAESPPTLDLLGTRGLPAAHGGFETFAERLALHLVARGWRVRVYGQAVGRGPAQRDLWRGIERVTLPVPWAGAFGTVVFDWRAIAEALRHARRHAEPPGLALTLGYNTAMFCARLRRAGWVQAINMDGLEWAREKWGPLARAWFRVNERAALHVAEHLVADHPVIEARLRDLGAGSVHGIAYGADAPPPADAAMQADEAAQLAALGLAPQRYLTLIARPEPENSVLEAVRGFSIRPRGLKLVVLGEYTDAQHYHRAVREAAGPEVRFPGPIYDAAVLRALRRHALAYVHGHRVGGGSAGGRQSGDRARQRLQPAGGGRCGGRVVSRCHRFRRHAQRAVGAAGEARGDGRCGAPPPRRGLPLGADPRALRSAAGCRMVAGAHVALSQAGQGGHTSA
jgi:glycosyltransferase involved in cell wall biosynthesis